MHTHIVMEDEGYASLSDEDRAKENQNDVYTLR